MSDPKRAALLVPCTSKEHLRDWFKVYLDFHIFDTISSRFATATPLDAAWEVYSFVMYPKTKKPANFLFASARSTQKTITLAALEVAVLLHAKRTVLHFAGSKDQVEAGYQYVKKFLSLPYVRDLIDGDITQSQTQLIIPNWDNEQWLSGVSSSEIEKNNPDSVKKIRIFVKTISPFTVQGQHESFVGKDEIHTLKGEKRQAYKDIRKIPVASWDGKPWANVGISSRKSPVSIVEQEIEEKDKTGLQIKQWTVFEGVEQCSIDRNGGDFVHERYLNVFNGDDLSPSEYELYVGKDKDKYSKTFLASGCLNCHLKSVCMGDLAKPKPQNKHYQSIDAAIVDFVADSDRDWYIAQCLSLQPSRQGIVFSRFKRDEFYVTPNEMYKRFTGQEAGKKLTNEEVVEIMIKSGVKRYLGLDHGFTDPAAFTVIYEDSHGREYVMHASAIQGMDPNMLVEYVNKLWERYQFTELFPDTAQPSINKLLKLSKKFKVCDDFDKKDGIANGIALIRGKIAPIEGGETKFIGLAGECDPLVIEMEKYSYSQGADGKYSDEPEDEFNHNCDSVRYIAINRWKIKGKLSLAGSIVESKEESMVEYKEKVEKQYNNWMDDKIKEIVSETPGAVSGGKSKNGKGFWSI